MDSTLTVILINLQLIINSVSLEIILTWGIMFSMTAQSRYLISKIYITTTSSSPPNGYYSSQQMAIIVAMLEIPWGETKGGGFLETWSALENV